MSASPRILIVAATFYRDIADTLIAGAGAALKDCEVQVVEVPGAFEIPAAIAMDDRSERPHDGYVALGCVIRGETSHYDYVCGESARALMDLSLAGLPIGYGILTVENRGQALVRAGEKNKGRDAAEACLAMLALSRRSAGAV